MSEKFLELAALAAVDLKVITIEPSQKALYLVSVDVSGLDEAATKERLRRYGQTLQRFIGGSRLLVMAERDGIADVRVFALESQKQPKEIG